MTEDFFVEKLPSYFDDVLTPTWNPLDRDNPLAPRPVDPLVLDLDGNGVTLVSTANSRVQFDIDIDAFAERIGWAGPKDGLLAIDKNANGRIDDASELFGNATTDGFTVLDAFDTTKDKKITAADADFVKLRVWRDADSDGITDRGELLTLAQLGITSISLTRTAVNYQNQGNRVAFEGAFTMNGQTRDVDAVFFAANQLLSRPILPTTFKYNSEVFGLPNLRGYGEVFDLWQKMSMDAGLRTQVKSLIDQTDTMTYAQLRVGFEAMLFKWAGVSGVSTTGRGQYIDGRQLALIEKLYDTDYLRTWGTNPTHPDSWTADQFKVMFDGIVDSMLLQFAVQTPYAYLVSSTTPANLTKHPLLPLAQAGAFDYATNKVTMDLPKLFKALADFAPKTTDAAVAYFKKVAPILNGLRLDQFAGDNSKFAAAVIAASVALPDVIVRAWATELVLGAATYEGTSGADTKFGTSGRDLYVAGLGIDTISDNQGSDTYIFRKGDGQDTIKDWGYASTDIDTLVLGPGILPTSVIVNQADNGRDLILTFAGSTDRIVIEDGNSGYGVDQVRFASGTVWTKQQLLDRSLGGTTGNDVLNGDARANTISGLAGNDTLDGDAGNDTLTGGTGNDVLRGEYGADTYKFNRGDGQDVIQDWGYSATGETDTIRFGAGITAADLIVTQADNGYDIVIAIRGTTDKMTIDGGVSDSYRRIELVRFADGSTLSGAQLIERSLQGTTASETLRGDAAANTLRGARGNDTLVGVNGSDTYVFNKGDGQDVIQDWGWGSVDKDTLNFGAGITPAEIIVTQSNYGSDLVISIRGTTDQVTIDDGARSGTYGIEQVRFANGTVWTRDQLLKNALAGTSGNDVLEGTDSVDTLEGNKGNDTLRGGYGADTYVFNRGDGQDVIQEGGSATGETDTIRFGAGITAADLIVTQADNGYDIVIALRGTTDKMTIDGGVSDSYRRIELVRFADGSTLSGAQLIERSLQGTTASETLRGDAAANTLRGARGNDTLVGDSGSDTYAFNRGDGQDVIQDWGWGTADRDTLVLGSGIKPSDIVVTQSNYGSDLVLSIRGTTDRVTIDDGARSGTYGIEQVRFADGTVWTRQALLDKSYAGTASNDVLSGDERANNMIGQAGGDTLDGDAGNDTLSGGTGNDTLRGGYGADTYVFNRGDGQDVIQEGSSATGETDTIRFGAGITAAELIVTQSDNGYDIVIALRGTTDRIIIDGGVSDSYRRIELVRFADGSTLTGTQLIERSLQGTAAGETLRGDTAANTFRGAGGNDTLVGDSGSDTYAFNRGDGQDVIQDWGWGTADRDTLVLGTGIKPSDLVVTQSNYGSDLVLSIRGTMDRVAIDDGNRTGAYGLEQVRFADGTTWTRQQMLDRSLTSAASADYLVGDARANRIEGGGGADTLRGEGGIDRFVYMRPTDGNDRIVDFRSGEDKLQFSVAGFGGGLQPGMNVGSAGRFEVNADAKPTAARGQFLYETNSGKLWWDSDGTGAGSKVLIATLDYRPALTSNDIEIV